MSKRQNVREKGFVLETSERALLAFMAGSVEQARKLCSEHWFVEELASYRSGGQPVWDGASELRIRRANSSEACEIQIALTGELARKQYEGHVFVFLVPIDSAIH